MVFESESNLNEPIFSFQTTKVPFLLVMVITCMSFLFMSGSGCNLLDPSFLTNCRVLKRNSSPDYDNFFRVHCFPVNSRQFSEVERGFDIIKDMYRLEFHLATRLAINHRLKFSFSFFSFSLFLFFSFSFSLFLFPFSPSPPPA